MGSINLPIWGSTAWLHAVIAASREKLREKLPSAHMSYGLPELQFCSEEETAAPLLAGGKRGLAVEFVGRSAQYLCDNIMVSVSSSSTLPKDLCHPLAFLTARL